MKACSHCNISKPIEDFYKRKDSPDGYRNDCKACVKKRTSSRYWSDPDFYRKKHCEAYRKKVEENPDFHRDRYWSDPEKARAQNRVNYKKHREKRIESAKLWVESNRQKARAAKAAYKATKKKATPPWVDDDLKWMMEQAYDLAIARSERFNFDWHVDHIVPLRGNVVSGLHLPWNLQVIPGSENCSKSNRWEV